MESLTLLSQEDTPLKNSVQSQVKDLNHEVEYHSVCPLVLTGTSPYTSPSSECVPPPPPNQKWRGHTRLRVWGWGSPKSDDWRKSLVICQLCDLNAGIVPQSQFSHSCVYKRFTVYIPGISVHIFGCSKIDRPLLDIYKSLTDIRVQELGDRVL
jgi:hypothetical protein